MKRRSFLFMVPAAIAGMSFRGFKIPALAYKDGKASVSWYLTMLYNQQAKGTSYSPKFVFVSEWLRDRYESELVSVQRFASTEGTSSGYKHLYFKNTTMIALKAFKGWQVEMV